MRDTSLLQATVCPFAARAHPRGRHRHAPPTANPAAKPNNVLAPGISALSSATWKLQLALRDAALHPMPRLLGVPPPASARPLYCPAECNAYLVSKQISFRFVFCRLFESSPPLRSANLLSSGEVQLPLGVM